MQERDVKSQKKYHAVDFLNILNKKKLVSIFETDCLLSQIIIVGQTETQAKKNTFELQTSTNVSANNKNLQNIM